MKAGTLLKLILVAVGITEERYKEVKELFGLPPDCKCAEREEWINKVVEYAIENWNLKTNNFVKRLLFRKRFPGIPCPQCPKPKKKE